MTETEAPAGWTEWQKIKPGSYGTPDGWNAWRIGGHWEIRTPLGQYHRAATYRDARALVESLRPR